MADSLNNLRKTTDNDWDKLLEEDKDDQDI